MSWPVPTSGEAMVSLKGRVGSQRGGRYRRRRFVRKYGKGDTFWVPWADTDESSVHVAFRAERGIGGNAARRWISLRPDQVAMAPRGVGTGWNVNIQYDSAGQMSPIQRKRLRILRWDGAFHLGLGSSIAGADWEGVDDNNNVAPHNVSWLHYLWIKQKREPQDGNLGDDSTWSEEEARWNVGPFSDTFWELMRRRDLRHHGVVPVYGATMPIDFTTPGLVYLGAHDPLGRMPKLPLPRLPKGGLVLNPGEELNCWVAVTANLEGLLVQATGQTYANGWCRPVVGMPLMRMLCAFG